MTPEEETLLRRNEQSRIAYINESIRSQLAAGAAVEDVVRPYGGIEGVPPEQILGSLAIAESYNMSPGQALAMSPSIFKQTHGKDYNLTQIVNDYYTKPKDFQLPFRYETLADYRAQIMKEETLEAEAFKRAKPDPLLKAFSFGGLNQAYLRANVLSQQQAEQSWFKHDKSEEKFVKGILTAETEDEKQELRRQRMTDLITEQSDRLQRLRSLESRLKSAETDTPGPWLSKYYALGTGVSRLRMTSYQATGEVLDIMGKISDSGTLKGMAEDMNTMARGYWQAMQDPEITPTPVNWIDRGANAALQNTPYGGLMIASYLVAGPAGPFAIFLGGAALEGTMIRQQSLDAGFSEESARTRGWIGGTINGLIEASSGGAAKYSPKKLMGRIAKFPGKLTNNALREIFAEEIPQEFVSMMLSGEVPYNKDGSLDWDEITSRMVSLASDTAFTSAFFTAGSSAMGEYSQWSTKRRMNKQFAHDVQIVMDNIMKEMAQEPPPVEFVAPEPTEAAERIISEEIYQKAKANLVDVTKVRMGVDPGAFKDLITVGAYWVETGIREFTAWSKKMIEEFGQRVKPHLHRIWQEVKPEKVEDEITIKEVPEAPEIDQIINESPAYGIVEEPDGKWTVTDWETQQEIKTGFSKKQATSLMNQYNTGVLDVPKRRVRHMLPTSTDMETLSHRQLLNVVFKKVSQQSRKIVKEVTQSIIQTKKDLIAYSKDRLEKIDITEGQRNQLLRKVALAVTENQKADTIATIESIREIARHRRADAEFRKLRQTVNRASRKRLSNGGIHYKVYDMLQELLGNYTTLSPKILNSIKRTESYLDGLRDSATEDFNAEYAEGLMPKSIISKFRELAATRIKDMSADELESLNDNIKHLLKLSQLWGKLIQNRKVQEARDFLNGSVAAINLEDKPSRVKRLRPKRGKLKQLWDAFLGYRNDDAYTLFSKIWGKFDPITMRLMRMRRGQLQTQTKLKDTIQSYLKDLNIDEQLKRWSPKMQFMQVNQAVREVTHTSADLYTVKIGGIERQFFMSEIMTLYMHTKANYNLSKIVKNGIGTYDIGIIGELTQEEFSNLLGILENDPVAKAFADKLAEFYIETAYVGNEVSRRLDGIDLFREEDYFHIEYVKEGGVIGAEYVRDVLVDTEGRFKPRTSSNRPVIIRDIFEILGEDIFVMSHFIGMTEQLRMLRSLVNYGPFRLKMRSAHVEHLLFALDKKTGNIQKTRQPPSGAFEKAVQRLGRGTARAALTMPNVWLYQPTSALLYLTEVSDKYMISLPGRISRTFQNELMNNWTLYRSRKEGTTGSKSVGMTSGIRKLFTNKGSAADMQLSGLHRGDMFGVSRAALITRREMSDSNMKGRSLEWWQNYQVNPVTLEYGSDEYWEAFNDRADYLVTLTQPMFFVENKGEYANSSNAVVREAARFRSFIDQALRIFQRQYAFRAKGDISTAEAARNMAITYLVLSLAKSIIKFGWDRFIMGREKELDELFADIATSPFALIPFIGYPLTKIGKTALGAKGQPPSYSMIATMLIDNILKHGWDVARGVHFLTDDEYIQSGPNIGKLKSEVYLKRGAKGAMQDYLVMQGIPAYAVDQIDWWKE